MRLLGLAQADPSVPTSGSGATTKHLLDALARRHDMVARRSVDLTPLQRNILAALTVHPSRERWKTRLFWGGRIALKARSFNSWRALRRVEEPFDLVVQLFGIFRTTGAPYVIYTDNTIELSRRHWPAWVDVKGKALDRLFAWERRLYGDALHVFTMGAAPARSMVEFYGVPEERVSAVGGGATLDVPRGAGATPREPAVLYVGGDWYRKGGDRLIEAFRIVRAKRPDARLLIVGTAEPSEEPGVEVVGPVGDRDRLAELYARASVFCLPSRFEPYGLSALEAMAYELPCVVTKVGGLEEIVLEGETGLCVAPEDSAGLAEALLRLLDDPDYARRLGRNGRSRVELHDNWDAVVERMTPDLEKALARPRGERTGRGSGRFSRGRRRAHATHR
jgi:glycosyltransferase involved in cell wall biosynthesis